jgi:hypothetical protein
MPRKFGFAYPEIRNRLLDAIHDGDGVGIAALLEYRDVDGVLPVYANDVGLELAACAKGVRSNIKSRRVRSKVRGSVTDGNAVVLDSLHQLRWRRLVINTPLKATRRL